MADISAFPTITNVVVQEGGRIGSYIATEAWKAGQVVGTAATAVSGAMVPMDATADEQPMGVAMYDTAAGSLGAVAMDGCIVRVAIADQTTGCEQGDHLISNDNAVQGTVSKLTLGIYAADNYVAGVAQENIAGNSTGLMLVKVGAKFDQIA